MIWALCRGTACPLTLQPSGMARVHVGRCALLEQTFLQCDSLLPPTHSHSFKGTPTNSASRASSPVAAPPLYSAPAISRLWGDSLTGPSSSALTNDWHHQPPIYSTPLRRWWVYCFVGDSGVTAGESLEQEGQCRSVVIKTRATCVIFLVWLTDWIQRGGNRRKTLTVTRFMCHRLCLRNHVSHTFMSSYDAINIVNNIQLCIKNRCPLKWGVLFQT